MKITEYSFMFGTILKKKKKQEKESNSGLLSILLFYILKRQLILLPMTQGLLWLALQIFVLNSTV